MKLKASGQARKVRDHEIPYRVPKISVRAPTKIDETTVEISGSVTSLALTGNFNMAIEMSAQEFGRFVMDAAEKSEALSALLKAAIATGDLARAGIRLRLG
jgi:hypothetical protein